MGVPNIKKELETLYTGTADVYDYVYEDNGHGAKRMSREPELVYSGIPCRLSYDTKAADDQDRIGDIVQQIAMYCDPSYDIKPGAKVVITQAGATQEYECAGLKAMYVSHQEIRLEVFRKKA